MSNIVYFIFSSEQMRLRKAADAKIGKVYKPGLVLVNGKYKQYTEIVNSPNKATYSDGIVVASGEKSKMKYKR